MHVISIGAASQVVQCPLLETGWVSTKAKATIVSAAVEILAPSSNTDRVAIFASGLSYDQDGTNNTAALGLHASDPGHPNSFTWMLHGFRSEAWPERITGMSSMAPMWFPSGLGIYVDIVTSARLNYSVIYKLGANPDPTTFIDMSRPNIQKNAGTYTTKMLVDKATNTNGALVYGYSVIWGETSDGQIAVVDPAGTYHYAADFTTEPWAGAACGLPTPMLIPAGYGFYIGGLSSLGSGGGWFMEYL